MKKYFFIISLLLSNILSVAQIEYELGSWDVYEDEYENYIPSSGVLDSRNGYSLSPQGQIRFLLVFVELEYIDPQEDPALQGTTEWPVGQLPIWKDDLLEYNSPSGLSDCAITQYFQLASSGNLIVLGDYLLSPDNGGVFKIPTTTGIIKHDSIIPIINQKLGNTFVTAHGFSSVSDFDSWKQTQPGETKINSSNNQWDFVVFIIRNSKSPGNSCGNCSSFSLPLLGHAADKRALVCSNREIPTHIIRHEFAHTLLGGNNFHSGGGGWGYGNGNYWIPQTGGWGLLGLYQCSLWTWSAWDRYRLGWVDSNNQFEISARDQNGVLEVNGDLDATNPNHEGIYTLRDFVTTGDALRIKLPFIDEDSEYPEWIWIENHQGYDNNDCEFDRWQFDNDSFPCVNGMTAGMMLYIQINNEKRISSVSDSLFSKEFYADYTRPLLANGCWDMCFPSEYVHNNCVSPDTVRPFMRLLENPFTGANDQDHYTYDTDGDNLIKENDQLPIWTEKTPDGVLHRHLYSLGNTAHVFTLQGNHKIGMGTNPSTATQINMVGEHNPSNSANNLRTTYLNGVSIEMIEQCSNGDIRVKIRFDDVDIENDMRWCSHDIKLNKINPNGYSLNLKKNTSLVLDRGLNATRMTNPDQFNGQTVFTSPSVFTVMPEVKMHIDTSAKLILENASKFHLMESSLCVVEDDGIIEIKSGTVFQMDDCSVLEINGGGLLIIRNGAELRISPNAILAFQNGSQNLIIESGVYINPHFADPQTLINSTISNVHINGTTTWNGWTKNVNGIITIEQGAILNIVSSNLSFINKNSGVIIQPGGKLIVDNTLMTNANTNCVDMWQGIEVWGNANAHQYVDHGNYLQGYLELKNGATIENAVCAVELWHPNDYSTTGGIVRADSAFFINNAKSVQALLYSNYNPVTGADMPYAASFDKCSFGIDSQYLGTQTFYKHIDIAHVDGFVFNGCSFTVANGVTGISPKCSAIAAYDAGFFVNAYCNSLLEPCPDGYLVHSSFSGFYDAVHAVHNGGTARSFVIKDAVFSNNDLGVYALNTGYASIRFNSFAVGRAYSCGYGIYVEDVTGLSIEENDFSPVVGYQGESYGIGVFNSLAPNDIYLNSFEGLTCGNFAYGLNTAKTQESPGTVQGLTYHCNQNTLNTIDFCVFNDHGDGGVCPLQGSSSRPAGNTFSGSDYHFYNDGENTVDYYYNSSATGQTPDNALLYRVNRFSTTNSSHCMSHGGGNVEKTQKGKEELKKDYQTATENFKRLVRLYEELIGSGSTSEELAELMSQIGQYAHDRSFAAGEIVRINLSDTVANPQELRTWLLNAGDIASDRMAIASLVQEGDFDSAMELAKRFPDLYNLKDDDLVDYTHYTSLLALFKTLHETGRTTEQLNDEEIKMVEGIASLATGVSRSLAKALLEGQQGDSRSNYLCPELPINNSKGDLDVNEKKTSDFEIKVSPNPAQSQVLIEYTLSESSSYGLLKLVNALGEKQMELQLESSKGRKLIDIHGLPTGLYLIIVTDLNGRSHHCKLIKN